MRFVTAATLAFAVARDITAADSPDYYDEPFRPQYHFTPEKNWMNDPNGLVFFEGEYHLFYQYNPFGDKWGHMSWGHAVSPDMVHWQHLPLALPEAGGVMIFSGSAVVDWNNTSGFGKNGKPPLVAIYTGYRPADNLQFQCIAYSQDKGRSWTKYSGNPVININSTDFRDPKVQWYEPAKCWLMVVALSDLHKVRFYRSPDLTHWTALSDFGPAGSTGGVWECPDFFALPVEGHVGEIKWVLIVNVGSGAPSGQSGTQYFVGSFDGAHFARDVDSADAPALWLDYGSDLYATATWNDFPKSDRRRVLIGWINHWPDGVPGASWAGVMSIPRELGLRNSAEGIRLAQRPVRELTKLRDQHFRFKGGDVAQANAWLRKHNVEGHQVELDLELEPSTAGIEGVKVLKDGREETAIDVDFSNGQVVLDRTRSGLKLSGIQSALLSDRGRKVVLHILLDACSVEVFVNDGETAFTSLVFPSADACNIEFFATEPRARISSVNAWTLKSAWK
jgi:fructan beta-fructosidase